MEEEDDEEDKDQKEKEEILREDPVAKWQFAYNENAMYANKGPETKTTNEEKSNMMFLLLLEKKRFQKDSSKTRIGTRQLFHYLILQTRTVLMQSTKNSYVISNCLNKDF